MRIGIDIDGVLANFGQAFCARVGLPLDYEPNDWDWSDSGLSRAQIEGFWEGLAEEKNFWLSLEPYKQNVESLRSFLATMPGAEVFYVTSRVPSAGLPVLTQTSLWLANQGLVVPNTSIIPVTGKPEAKPSIVQSLGISAILDDRGETIAQFHRELPSVQARLLDRPWNTSYTGLPRDYSVQEFLANAAGMGDD